MIFTQILYIFVGYILMSKRVINVRIYYLFMLHIKPTQLLKSHLPQPCPIPAASKNNATLNGVPDGAAEIEPGASFTIKCHSRYQIEDGLTEQAVKCVAADTYQPPAPVCRGGSS